MLSKYAFTAAREAEFDAKVSENAHNTDRRESDGQEAVPVYDPDRQCWVDDGCSERSDCCFDTDLECWRDYDCVLFGSCRVDVKPKYKFTQTGPSHQSNITAHLQIGGDSWSATDKNAKEAKKRVAQMALEALYE